jgi:hypothetical protein
MLQLVYGLKIFKGINAMLYCYLKKTSWQNRIKSKTASNLAGWVSAACWNAVGKTAYVR